ncbi:hypothetical protein GCM10009745_70760 [Kribbella yunnanensis]|uniref:Type II secretion system protein GspF domain-containing protein n=1 Tax=Kribbella yunnanensis TaxID=190194 RepID=A0ABN2IVI4_9ACTN
MRLPLVAELLLALVLLPTAMSIGGLVWAAPLLDRFHQRRMRGQDSVHNWLCHAVPAALTFVLVGGSIILSGLAITMPNKELGVAPAVALTAGVAFLAVAFLHGTKPTYQRAEATWACDTGLKEIDKIVGVQEIVRYRRWRWIAITCLANGIQADLMYLVVQGPDLRRLEAAGVIVIVGAGMAWLGLRLVALAHPAGEFLEILAAALNANANHPAGPGDGFIDLNKLRDHQLGTGGAELMAALPALQRALNSILSRYPALPEDEVRAAATPLFEDLRSMATARQTMAPADARRAVRLVILGELPTLAVASAVRPLGDGPGWNRTPSVFPGEIGHWLPYTATRIGRIVAAIITVVGIVGGLLAATL